MSWKDARDGDGHFGCAVHLTVVEWVRMASHMGNSLHPGTQMWK